MTRNSFITDERISSEGLIGTFVRRVKEGQLGSFPVILALVVIVIVFQTADSNFISPANLVNLSTQVAFLAILALGINLILLLGEIDLSLAQLGGLAASLLGVLVVRQGVPPLIALVIMLLLGLVVGAVQGWFFAVVGIPAFVVTLAGLLAFTGLTLTTLGTQKNLSMSETFAFDFASYYFPAIWAYVFGAIAIIGFGAGIIYSKLRRHREGLSAPSWTSVIVRIVLLAAIVFGFLILINQDFGLAMPFFLMMVIAIVIDLVLRKTRYGRSIYAVGGKVEAARRAGIRVTWVRISVFMTAGVLAALFPVRVHQDRCDDECGIDPGQHPGSAQRDRGGRHRRNLPVRRARFGLGRGPRRTRRRRDQQRSLSHRLQLRRAADHHRARSAHRRRRRCAQPPRPQVRRPGVADRPPRADSPRAGGADTVEANDMGCLMTIRGNGER